LIPNNRPVDLENASIEYSMLELMQGRKYGNDELTKYSSKMSTKKDEQSVNTCEMEEEFNNATDYENQWSKVWLMDTGASGNVTYSDYKMTNMK
jgi:hypothetical protein